MTVHSAVAIRERSETGNSGVQRKRMRQHQLDTGGTAVLCRLDLKVSTQSHGRERRYEAAEKT